VPSGKALAGSPLLDVVSVERTVVLSPCRSSGVCVDVCVNVCVCVCRRAIKFGKIFSPAVASFSDVFSAKNKIKPFSDRLHSLILFSQSDHKKKYSIITLTDIFREYLLNYLIKTTKILKSIFSFFSTNLSHTERTF
jgi:hypothetical protein